MTFIRYAHSENMSKPYDFKVFGNKKTKGPKQDRQNRLRINQQLTYEFITKKGLYLVIFSCCKSQLNVDHYLLSKRQKSKCEFFSFINMQRYFTHFHEIFLFYYQKCLSYTVKPASKGTSIQQIAVYKGQSHFSHK